MRSLCSKQCQDPDSAFLKAQVVKHQRIAKTLHISSTAPKACRQVNAKAVFIQAIGHQMIAQGVYYTAQAVLAPTDCHFVFASLHGASLPVAPQI